MINSADFAVELGLESLALLAVDEGRYVWARIGFQANMEYWFATRKSLMDRLVTDNRFALSPDRELALKLISSDDSLGLHFLTGLKGLVPVEAGEKHGHTAFGRALLLSIGSWYGVFDLRNQSYIKLLKGSR